MPGRRDEQPGCLVRMMDGFLDLIDWIAESIGNVLTGLITFFFRGIWTALCLLARGLWLLLRLILFPLAYVMRRMTGRYLTAEKCAPLTGTEFEEYAAVILRDAGFRHVESTGGSGDQGVDILCERNGRRYAIQCKQYSGSVGNAAVQEAYAGMQFYGCDKAVVLCTTTFTASAVRLAKSTGVTLWDHRMLTRLMRNSGRRPRHRR